MKNNVCSDEIKCTLIEYGTQNCFTYVNITIDINITYPVGMNKNIGNRLLNSVHEMLFIGILAVRKSRVLDYQLLWIGKNWKFPG